MSASLTLSVYERHDRNGVQLTAVGIGAPTFGAGAKTLRKAEERLKEALRKAIAKLGAPELARFDLRHGLRLHKVHLTLNLGDDRRRKLTGRFPLVVEPRDAGDGTPISIVYHPDRPQEWFAAAQAEATPPSDEELSASGSAYFSAAWAELSDWQLQQLRHEGKDTLRILSFSAEPPSLLASLGRKKGAFDDLIRKGEEKKQSLLRHLGTDLTEAIAYEPRGLGLPRARYREDLEAMFARAGAARSGHSVLLVGPPKCGKTTLVRQLVADLLAHDGYPVHKNLDRVTHVVQLSGRQLIAGMSHVGQWEERATELIAETKRRGAVLYLTDLHTFGRTGQARDSERALADVFREPVMRGDIAVIGECTETELQRLEDEAPELAAAFTKLHVAPATRAETFRMLLARVRDLEAESDLTVWPAAYEQLLETSGALFGAQALPGRAVDLLDRVAREATGRIALGEIEGHVSRETGLDYDIVSSDEVLSPGYVASALGETVIGQPRAVREMAELVVRIKGNLCDPKRPLGVFLFTGPTGTGKTELAKAFSSYLYGAARESSGERGSSRLVRFDMSELSGPDAVARLIGDAWEPEGQLTAAGLAQPFAVYLFDEIEKAHRAVHALLLQLFDDGRLTDAKGQTADFRKAVFIMTSNLGAAPKPAVGFHAAPEAQELEIARAVREFFAPELVNRFDAVVPFSALSADTSVQVAHKELGKLFARQGLADRNLFVRIDGHTVEKLAAEAFQSQDGARSLKRFLEDRIATQLGEAIAASPGSMQVLRIDDALEVRAERIVEKAPVATHFALESLWKRPRDPQGEEVSRAIELLESLRQSPQVETLGEQLRALLAAPAERRDKEAYDLEWARLRIDELQARLEKLRHGADDEPEREFEPQGRTVDRSHLGRGFGREMLTCLAEAHLLARALRSERLTSEAEHAVVLELLPLSARGFDASVGRNLLRQLARVYVTARGALESVAWIHAGGVKSARGPDALVAALREAPDLLVLKLVGLSVYDFFEPETGLHVWHRSVSVPELLRVRAFDGTHAPVAVAERFAAQKADPYAAERWDALLPLVRQIRFDEPSRGRPPNPLEIEDYSVGLFDRWRARELGDVLLPLWLLRATAEAG